MPVAATSTMSVAVISSAESPKSMIWAVAPTVTRSPAAVTAVNSTLPEPPSELRITFAEPLVAPAVAVSTVKSPLAASRVISPPVAVVALTTRIPFTSRRLIAPLPLTLAVTPWPDAVPASTSI